MANRKTLCCVVAALLFLALAPQCAIAQWYSPTLLQAPTGLSKGVAHGVNDSGQIVGGASDSALQGHPVIWNADGSAHELALPTGFVYGTALDINASGQCVGLAFDSTETIEHGVMWDSAGNPMDLGAYDGAFSVACGINSRGQIVGYSGMPDGKVHIVTWDAGGQISDLGLLGRGDGINDSGQICGEIDSVGVGSAFLLSSGQVTDLAGLLTDPHSSEAMALNNHGDVAGNSNYDDPVLWLAGGGVVHLGVLGTGWSYAWSINDALRIAGFSTVGDMPFGSAHAVVWGPTGAVTDINGDGMTSSHAYDISNIGLIVGNCSTSTSSYAVKWVLVPEPPALAGLLLCCGGILLHRRRR